MNEQNVYIYMTIRVYDIYDIHRINRIETVLAFKILEEK